MTSAQTPGTEGRRGFAYGLTAYGLWGFFPLFWKQLDHVPPFELLLHRVVWAFAFFVLLGLLLRRLGAVREALANKAVRRALIASSVLVAGNWFLFVYAIATDRILHASLGYFINPLVSVVLGMVFLRERLRPLQWIAVALATVGVAQMAAATGGLPWISIMLALSFGSYGLIRKTAAVEALPGTTTETLLLGGPCLAAILLFEFQGQGHFVSVDARTTALMFSTGAVTATPLWLFANAARRVSLTALGFMQYLAPTMHFLLAVWVFDEPLGTAQLVTFGCIWTGVGLFVLDRVRLSRT